jgi:ParB-like chromosome segregation protein Spo0J
VGRRNGGGILSDPIDSVEWWEASKLSPNGYNPNVVMTPELKLLEESIVQNGWTFPIVINPEFVIIDGFHRWKLAQDSPTLVAKYGTLVPCVTVNVSTPEAMLMTVRMNRARGTHVGVQMSHIVRSLKEDYGLTDEELKQGIGASQAEVDLLSAGSLLKTRNLEGYRYSRAWVPVEVSETERAAMIERGEAALPPDPERDDELTEGEVV